MYTKLVFTPYDVCQGIVGILVPKQDVPSVFPVQCQDNLLRWWKKENEGGGTSTMSSNLSNSPLITDSARSSCCFQGFSLLLTWWSVLPKQAPWQSLFESYLWYLPHLLDSRWRGCSKIGVDGREKELWIGRREKVHRERVCASSTFVHPCSGVETREAA